MPAGKFTTVGIQTYTANWAPICKEVIDITVGGGGDPCAGKGGDSDGDGVCNADDNCVNTFNPGQQDSDGDGIGDACDTADPCANAGGDSDGDGVCDNVDNCVNTFNPGQQDSDGDGKGDACDNDCVAPTVVLSTASTTVSGPFTVAIRFNESVNDLTLAEVQVSNGTKSNPAGGGSSYSFTVTPTGNANITISIPAGAAFNNCGAANLASNVLNVTVSGGDPCANAGGDSDGDGVCDNVDNCVNTPNPGQQDSDGDGIGDACDAPDDCEQKTLVRYNFEKCRSFSNDGSAFDFSEFTPIYPNNGGCVSVTASNAFRSEGGHSCVEGANGSDAAICIPADRGSRFKPDDDDALRFSVTVDPGSAGKITELSFMQWAPDYYSHLSGNSGNNNPPRKFGVRVLKDGNEIYRKTGLNTARDDFEWVTFSFDGNSKFEVDRTTTFSFEIMSYDPKYNSTPNFFDIDNIKVKGCCINNLRNNGSTLEFYAETEQRQVQLDWMTNTEFINERFIVERSEDGIQFEPILEQMSNYSTSAFIDYQAVDTDPIIGTSYYRLKEIFKDGSFIYSEPREVQISINLNELAVFPNPTTHEAYLHLKEHAGKAANIQIYNALGQLMMEREFDSLPHAPIQLDVQGYRSGMYTVTIQLEQNRRVSTKLIVTKL
ncbi:MAG: thrombospondin type 3 repeat-containing protein [Bacteroidota bacterium]